MTSPSQGPLVSSGSQAAGSPVQHTPLPIDVVSIQSQVVYGCVGNNVAMPALQAHGLCVAAVPTVVFSNTPHYPEIFGSALPVEWFNGCLQGLQLRANTNTFRAILVGYLGSAEQAIVAAQWIAARQAENPQLLVVIDPVIGDHDSGIYVKPELIAAYREHLLPRATLITPNTFELQLLTGMAVGSGAEVLAAAQTLLGGRLTQLVVTSAAVVEGENASKHMQIALVSEHSADMIAHPYIEIAPRGTGDLFAAELTAQLLAGLSLQAAAQAAGERLVAVLARTRAANCEELLLQPLRQITPPA